MYVQYLEACYTSSPMQAFLHGMLSLAFVVSMPNGIVQAQEAFVKVGQQPLDVSAFNGLPELGIVSTWHGIPLTWAESWLRYHIAIGFTRIYLFFDNPEHDKEVIDRLANAPEYSNALTIIKVDKKYREKYWTHQERQPNINSDPEQWLLPAFGVHINTEHTARQILNVARAGVLAKADNISWLLHIDADEIFWLQDLKSGIAKNFFAQLNNRRVTHASFINDEVTPRTPDYEFKKLPKDPFHQRLFFKRNEMTLAPNQAAYVRKWQDEKGVKFFLGYMCGKGAINVDLWRQHFGDDLPILPQHVVNFAYNFYQPGNVTLINQDSSKVLPYISSKKIKIASISNVGRILHYMNPDFDSMFKKFSARTKFNVDIFDASLASDKERKLYAKWQSYWIEPEKMPSWEFYNEMWSLVRIGLKENNNSKALKFYTKGAVAPQGKSFNQYSEVRVVYKNKDVKQFLLKISELLETKGIDKNSILMELANGTRHIDVGSSKEDYMKVYVLHGCKEKAPHFLCDVENCCQFLRWPQFTFTKRLLGYKRYQAFEWWKPGLRWPR